jgi:hypothetical protein
MALDFTLIKYEELLKAFISRQYRIMTFENYYEGTKDGKLLVIRHDVDDLPLQSLYKAEIEHRLGLRTTYYFRIVQESNHPDVIRKIAALGHEIGYHYEDLSLANGNQKKAIKLFEKNLAYFRTFYPVRTICMHGSPTSIWDNRLIWREHNYRGYNIIAEPYFDTDFSSTFYITDTGRRWDGDRVSVRDKVNSKLQQEYHFRHTSDIIKALQSDKFPEKAMITTHPQRWHNNYIPWMKELVLQNFKNAIKKSFYVQNPMMD